MNYLATFIYGGSYVVACLAVVYAVVQLHSERKLNFGRLFFIALMLTPLSVILHELIMLNRRKLRNDQHDTTSKSGAPLR